MADPAILVEIEEGLATVTLNRPEKLNAISPQMGDELEEALAGVREGAEVGRIVAADGLRPALAWQDEPFVNIGGHA